MIKLIVCDLDETLLNTQKHIPQNNLDAIAKAQQEYGVRFVPASGRGYTGMINVLKELGADQQEDHYTISNNGGITIENKDFRHITFHAFYFDAAQQLFQHGIQLGLCVEVFTAEDVYGFQLNDAEKDWLFMFKKDAVLCDHHDLTFLKEEPIVKILFETEDMHVLKQIAEDMKELTKDIASVSFSSSRYLELNPLGVDKGIGLQELASYLHIPMEDTLAIGDNYNDLEMLQMAGVSVAVANAQEDIKQAADYVTQRDHNAGAVAEAIEHYIFQK